MRVRRGRERDHKHIDTLVPWLEHSDQSDCSIGGVCISGTPPCRLISGYSL